MRNLLQSIEKSGGIDALKRNGIIKLRANGFMDLVIEHVGKGPRGLHTISVAHYYLQNGDMMRDPEIVFEVSFEEEKGKKYLELNPIEFRQDGALSIKQILVWNSDVGLLHRPKLIRSVKSFSIQWDKNLKAQGFFK
ncbi:DUF6908 domain-containing protein [Leptospira andrefontaineae]|uniref:DUF6908 domain-containing protein n=1 Tax=Leptospira andrefontaineae TaxID=2484976 RepID=A0A4R9GXA2_9LEPT|nr:hypothetical protein [Leptospira andrefontaineae]TGK36264.1 hypothetical protein EHO65_18360 [Leptospira andrefontaineae]